MPRGLSSPPDVSDSAADGSEPATLRFDRRVSRHIARGVLGNRALVAWAIVSAVAMLSFFVHLLNEQVHRGQALRAQMASGVPTSQGSFGPYGAAGAMASPMRRQLPADGPERAAPRNGLLRQVAVR